MGRWRKFINSLRDWLDPNGTGTNNVDPYPALVLLANDIGVESIDSPVSGTLTDSESVTVSITNFGENAATNFDVSFQVDGGEVVTETYTGTVASEETVQHTFSTTVDMSVVGTTYSVTAYTSYDSDEDSENDSISVDVTHLDPNDIGVSEITSPSSGELLSNAESVTVTITNYGGATQYDFDVTYEFNGLTVTETVAGPLEGNSSMEYTFTQTVDVSVFGTYTITVYTSLDGDSDTSNDSLPQTLLILIVLLQWIVHLLMDSSYSNLEILIMNLDVKDMEISLNSQRMSNWVKVMMLL